MPEFINLFGLRIWLHKMEALTGDSRFTEQIEKLLKSKKEGEEIRMCEYLDMLEAEGKKKGEKIGEARLGRLIQALLKEEKYKEIEIASTNRKGRKKLYHKYNIT